MPAPFANLCDAEDRIREAQRSEDGQGRADLRDHARRFRVRDEGR